MRVSRLLLFSCTLIASSAPLSATTPAIVLSPGASTITVNQTLQYKATVTGLSNTAVTWQVSGVAGGNATAGTISVSGLYKAPATLAAGSEEMSITAIASDGKTKATVSVIVQQIGPSITSVAPNPIPPGKYTVVIRGSGFTPKSIVRNGATLLTTSYVNPTQIYASGAQATTTPAVFQVQNSGSTWGPQVTVHFTTSGPAPVIAPKTVYIHLSAGQVFTCPGANYWLTTAGTITQGGLFVAPNAMPASSTVTITAAGPAGIVTAQVKLAGGPNQTISPGTATLGVSQKLQFTSAGATVWTAQYGTISSTGLYTAPSVWPVGAADQITANGPQGWASEKIAITAPTPAITAVGSNGHIPLGLFSVIVKGANLSPASSTSLLGVGLESAYANGQLRVSGFAPNVGPATIKVSNGPLSSNVFPVEVGWSPAKASPAAARRFLEQAAFGPSPSDADVVQAIGQSAWLNQQFGMRQYSNFNNVTAKYGGMPEQFLTNAVGQPDQLRQRVAFALSQIFVTSLDEISNQNMVTYQDMFLADAFTNYKQIMTDVTLSPAMGQYLNMANNAKADPNSGSVANENFAREMLQLFTIGTSMLNPDGSVQVDANNLPIPTYSQFQITEFARVYTGWTYAPAPGKSLQFWAPISDTGPLEAWPAEHDSGSKQLLNGYVAPAGLSPRDDLNAAIDNIFNHPNVGPFVANLLIQHLVKSNPSPAYIARVAAAFNNNGSGVRGDMKAIVTAILMDPEARANDEGGNDQPGDGHLQEPALFISGMVRAFGGQMTPYDYYAWELSNLGQNVFDPASVFNYFAPNYGVPGTAILGPEFQIDTPNSAVIRANEISILFSAWSSPIQTFGPGTTVDITPFVNLGSNPAKLVDALDLTLTHGVMPAAMKSAIVTAVAGESGGNLRRVQRAIYLILSSSYYNIWH